MGVKPKKKQTRAERNIAWVEKRCRIPEGKYVGKPLKLAPFMRDDLIAIYGNPAGTGARSSAQPEECECAVHLCDRRRNQTQPYSAALAETRRRSCSAKMLRSRRRSDSTL
jgi:hypothetical protein